MANRTKLTLLKQDGTTIPDIDAVIKPMEILIINGKLPVEEGDILMRTLPGGLLDKFTIVDRGFNSHPKPHYQAKYTKASVQSTNASKKKKWYETFWGILVLGIVASLLAWLILRFFGIA
jgi:hypothetical protein